MPENLESSSSYPFYCRVTPWYFKRMGMMTLLIAGFGLYFLFDGQFGYPKANKIADKKVWFEEVVLKSFDESKQAGKLDQWLENAKSEGWPTGREGEPPRWVSYAAQNGWPEKPHRYTEKEITDQFWWGGVTLCIALFVGMTGLWNRKKVLVGDADHFVTPEGKTVRYADVVRVDKRQWDGKGLAYVWHQPPGGKEQKVVVDDLKYEGASRVLELVLSGFQGEILDKTPVPAPEQEPSANEN